MENNQQLELERIIELFRDSGKYGMNWCLNENRPRDPNSIGECDNCGGVVRLKTLAEAILFAGYVKLEDVELDEEKIKEIVWEQISNGKDENTLMDDCSNIAHVIAQAKPIKVKEE